MCLPAAPLQVLKGRLRKERGSATTTLVMMPVVMLVFFLAVHAASLMYTRQVVAAAAHDALTNAQLSGASEGFGEAAGLATLAQASSISKRSVSVDINERTVEVVASANFNSVLGDDFEVRAELTGPREIPFPEEKRLGG